jgi:probable rRNA maturation factor
MMTLDVMSAKPRTLTTEDITRIAQRLQRSLRLKGAISIGVRFVSLEEIQTLNRTFRRKNRPTDVLSFSARPSAKEASSRVQKEKVHRVEDEEYWGDLAICSDYAKEEAKRRGLPVREELLRLLAHGVLHLAGYDHATERTN